MTAEQAAHFHRKRLHHYEVPGHARFLTFSCFQRLPLFGNPSIRDEFAIQIERVRSRGVFRLLGWAIMPEHVHLMMIPCLPDHSVSLALSLLKRPFAERVIERWRELNAPILARLANSTGVVRFWQRGGGYDRNIDSDQELREKIEYMHDNPIRRGLAEEPAQWKWSSARWYEGDYSGLVKIDPFG